MSSITPPVVRAEMLIRRPVADVYRAFVDPAETRQFWFTAGSAVLREGETVTWEWEMYGAAADVEVVALEPDRRIVIRWPTPVEWTFTPRGVDRTFVTIEASGFTGTADEQVAQALDAMGGFTLVLAGCKAWLEHGVRLALVADRNPELHV